MAGEHLIPILPFPPDIDRDHFGHWLSGLTDGEGCFHLGMTRRKTGWHCPYSTLSINLREDDRPILNLVRSYLNVGIVTSRKSRNRDNKQASYRAYSVVNLVGAIIPHFDKYPLRAKKARDYEIWRQGVMLHYSVWKRKRIRVRAKPGETNRLQFLKWTSEEKVEFFDLAESLKKIRLFTESLAMPCAAERLIIAENDARVFKETPSLF